MPTPPSRNPERIERFTITITITRPAEPAEVNPVERLRNEWQKACDDLGVPYGWFNIIANTPAMEGVQEFTLIHERSLEHENEIFNRTSDPSDKDAAAQVLAEYNEAKDELKLPWLIIHIASREVDSNGTWATIPTSDNAKQLDKDAPGVV
jgi:hypothetical protein